MLKCGIPENWLWTELNEICQSVEKTNEKSNNPNKEFLYLDINSIDNKINQIVEPKTYKWADAPSRAQQIVKSGDILFSTVRTYLKNIARVRDEFENQIASTGFCVIRPFRAVNSKFIFHYTLTNRFIDSLSAIQRGSSYPAVRNSDVLAQKIPLPPLVEQHRIVAKIEELFSDLEDGIASLKKAQAQLKTYRQAVLKYAFEGKLTAAWRQQHQPEPAEKLLAQIKAERERQNVGGANGKTKKPKEFPPLMEAELAELPRLPEGWRWVKLGGVAENIQYGYTAPSSNAPIGPKMLRITDIQDSKVNWNEVPYCSIPSEQKGNYLLKEGDLVFARTGATVGKSFLINDTIPESVFASYLIRISLPKTVNEKFLYSFFQSIYYWQQITEGQVGIGQPNVNGTKLSELIFPLSSKEEQHQIVQEIESRLSVCDKLEESIKDSLQKAEALRQSILKKAFAGKLAPQDPNDEPAEKLLERIKAEKS